MRFALRDLVYAARLLRRNPGFSLLAIFVIALGIGAATAIFSLVDGVLLHPLPFRDPGRLAVIWSDFSASGGNRRAFSAPGNFLDWRERSRSFQEFAAQNNTNKTFTALDRPITPLVHAVTANYFDVLGVSALRGRTFLRGEDQAGHDHVVLVSRALWTAAFGASDSAIGSAVELDGESYRLIGVLPEDFRVPNNGITAQPDLWIPTSFDKQRLERSYRSLVAFARLKPGVDLPQARAEMAAITTQIAREHVTGTAAPGATVEAIAEGLTGDLREPFLILLGAVGMILLIGCANVANLLLAQSSARVHEFAVRSALGASRGQLVRQMLLESLTLALAGGAAGVLLAKWTIGPMLHLLPESAGVPYLSHVDVSLPVLAFAIALCAVAALLFGLSPVRIALHPNLIDAVKEGGRSRISARQGRIFRNCLIVAEVAFSLVLLVSAGLMLQTFWRISRLQPGFEAAHVLTVRNSLRGDAYAAPDARRRHFALAAERLSQLPGVESVSAVSFPVPIAPFAPTRFTVAGRAADPLTDFSASTLTVMPRFFETLRTPILGGRSITDADTADTIRVAVVSQELARRYFPNSNPVGQSIVLSSRTPAEYRIVGVAGNIRGAGLAADPQPIIYFPHAQDPVSVMSFLVRTAGDPAALGQQAERTLWSLGKLMNVYSVTTLERSLADSYWQTRFTAFLLAVFAALALVLASTGIYAVISYLAAQRTQEIGVRMALGARSRDVLWMVTGQGLRLAAVGVVIGETSALALGRFIASRLYGVTPADPVTLAAVAALLLAVTAAACAVPAVRAARIDPVRALRNE